MKVLMITGDRRFGPGNPRYELQKSAVEVLDVMYWGPGALIPRIPFKKYDVITAQDPFFRGHLAWHLTWFMGARLNIQVHVDLDSVGIWKHVFAHIQLRHADTVRVVSEKLKTQVLRMAPRAKITVLPIFVELEKFRTVIPQQHSGKNILWVGRFEEEKNPMAAIDILKEVLKSIPDARLVMLGEGTMTQKVRDYAAHMPINQPIFEGWADPAFHLEKADVVLCTSWHESFGASMIEALAAGVPVVAPDVGVAKEAGAMVVEDRTLLADAVVTVLREGTKGTLLLNMPTAQEWTTQWQKSL